VGWRVLGPPVVDLGRHVDDRRAGKAGLDRLSADMALELRPKGVACCSVCPGSVATEFIKEWAARRGANADEAQTTVGVGRTIAALACAADLMDRSGTIQWVEDLAEQFDVVDEYGRRPAKYPNRRQP
jgi:dehydrogenase/reductase SDR family member 1